MFRERSPSPLAVTGLAAASLVLTSFAILLEQKSRTGVPFNDGVAHTVAGMMLVALLSVAVMLSIEERRA